MSPTTPPIPPALADVLQELDDARRRAHALAEPLDDRRWSARPPRGGWGVAECLVHLNVSSEQFLPIIQEALRRATADGLVGEDRGRMDLLGRVLLWTLEPPYRMKVKTTAAFEPVAVAPRDQVLARFDALQDALVEAVRSASGLRISDLKVVSPFDARVRYSLYSFLRIIAGHQRRHLWQAEQAVAAVDRAGV